MRLNSLSSRRWKITHWILFVCTTLFLLASLFFPVLLCRPVTAAWNIIGYAYLDKPPQCFDLYNTIVALNVVNVLTDAALLIVPVVMLWSVQMKVSAKLRVWSAGIVGCVNIIISIIRTLENNKISTDITCESFSPFPHDEARANTKLAQCANSTSTPSHPWHQTL